MRPYKALLGSVAVAVVVAVAVADTFRMGGITKAIPPFLLENIIPAEAVFSPLSFIFWRDIIWTPEMWGKGGREVLPFF